MSISYQFGDVRCPRRVDPLPGRFLGGGAPVHVRDVLAAGDFWGGSGSWLARSSSPSWVATSRSSTNKPTATARKSRPPATTCRPPTPPSAAAGPNARP